MRSALLMMFVGCSSTPPVPPDVVGPFTGDSHRFVVDRISLPDDPDTAMSYGDDLDGDGKIDNRTANLIIFLGAFHNTSLHAADIIASGALASEVEIVADDLAADDTVAVLYHGMPGDQPVPVGGRLSAAGFAPNRTRYTRVPGEAVARLPVFADADPVAVRIVGLQIALTSDGRGGFDGNVAGGILLDDLADATFAGMVQMVTANPQDHVSLANLIDADHDAVLTRDEVVQAPLVTLLYRLDIQLFDDGRFAPVQPVKKADALSIGFAIHLSPCASGRCSTGATADPCHDRVRDGDETDIDCGGSCGPCGALSACRVPGDCQTSACDTGRCRAPSCGDSLLDGFESDIDCGGNCAPCARGQRCTVAHDCASGLCSSSVSFGRCM